jgi:hypothetical protein
MNKCLTCGKPVKNKYCNVSCQNRHQSKGKKRSQRSIEIQKENVRNRWKYFSVKCYKCDKDFEIKEYNVDKPKKEKYYCSKKCANSRIWTEEQKMKVSNSVKLSEKAKKANELRRGISVNKIERTATKCLKCGLDIIHKVSESRKYHQNCWREISGGVRKGSSRGKHGWYKKYWCDSSYELAWVIYQIEHNQIFQRNTEGFEYIFDNKVRKYYPDFILNDGTYVEIKNFKSKITDSKLKYFPHNIIILYKEEIIRDILPYVYNKYGKNFITLFEKKER